MKTFLFYLLLLLLHIYLQIKLPFTLYYFYSGSLRLHCPYLLLQQLWSYLPWFLPTEQHQYPHWIYCSFNECLLQFRHIQNWCFCQTLFKIYEHFFMLRVPSYLVFQFIFILRIHFLLTICGSEYIMSIAYLFNDISISCISWISSPSILPYKWVLKYCS